MSSSITFIFPELFAPHCQNFMDEDNHSSMEQLTRLLRRSGKQQMVDLQTWIASYFKVANNYHNSANLMAQAEGLALSSETQQDYWLRADPVMLTATHNGILCRGNRVLNLSEHERNSLQLLLNEHFSDQSIEIFLSNDHQGYLKTRQAIACQFTPISEVIGKEISQYLPVGDDANYWHGLLTDLQMLLHNCAVNQQRIEAGLPVISGIWIWGGTVGMVVDTKHQQNLYTDDAALAGAIGKNKNINQLEDCFIPGSNDKDMCIYVSEFMEASLQNDNEGWNTLFQQWVNGWLLPALKAVDDKVIESVILLPGDGYQYKYNKGSRWCFWRNHGFV